MGSPGRSVVEERGQKRFWKKVNKNGPVHPVLLTPCWLWTGYRFTDGYGGIMVNYEFMRCHRYSWRLATGEDAGPLHVLHKCDTPTCINPGHLFLGSEKVNKDDAVTKDRHARGEVHGAAKLTDEGVRQIRRRYRKGCRKNGRNALAREFGVAGITITYALRKGWKHV